MKIKIKGVCVDINKPRTQEDLTRLLNVCKSEVSTASQPRKSFINMFVQIIENKLKKEYNLTINNKDAKKRETQFA
tara:strand:+ start:146 stop:373 length:228 start_codon:yes stop_codon:yes gene_type:complete